LPLLAAELQLPPARPAARRRSAALPAAPAQAAGCRLRAAGAAAWLLRIKPAARGAGKESDHQSRKVIGPNCALIERLAQARTAGAAPR
jgi:hypothetical protein